jgi:hypothetical protein
MSDLRPPIVTDADRTWALDQCPVWAVRGSTDPNPPGEIIDTDSEPEKPRKVFNWDVFVCWQIERFERFHAHERKLPIEWSGLWRKSWWPKAEPLKFAPKLVPSATAPVFRRGEPEFKIALSLATAGERCVFERMGVASFQAKDPRLQRVLKGEVVRSVPRGKMAAAGDA